MEFIKLFHIVIIKYLLYNDILQIPYFSAQLVFQIIFVNSNDLCSGSTTKVAEGIKIDGVNLEYYEV